MRNLSALSQFVDEYYADLAAAAPDENTRFSINFKRSALMSSIQDRINVTTGRNAFQTILDILMDDDSETSPSPADARKIVSGEFVPLTGDYFSVVNSRVMTNFEDQVTLLLDLATITALPAMAPVIADNTAWTYTPSSISGISSSFQPSGGDSGTGPSEDTSPVGDSSADIGSSSSDGSSPDSGSNSTSCSELKPLRFSNNGFEPATVRVETYQPAAG